MVADGLLGCIVIWKFWGMAAVARSASGHPPLHVTLKFGYMETPNVPKTLAIARKQGPHFDIMSTSFFLSRRPLKDVIVDATFLPPTCCMSPNKLYQKLI